MRPRLASALPTGLLLLLALHAPAATPASRAGEEPPPATTAVVTLRVEPGIDCPGCEARLHDLLAKGRGVRRVEVDVMESRVVVRYEPARCTVAALQARVEATGYHARPVR